MHTATAGGNSAWQSVIKALTRYEIINIKELWHTHMYLTSRVPLCGRMDVGSTSQRCGGCEQDATNMFDQSLTCLLPPINETTSDKSSSDVTVATLILFTMMVLHSHTSSAAAVRGAPARKAQTMAADHRVR